MARGDTDALATFYDRWSPQVRGLAVRMLGEAADADEVVEEVFWQAWKQADRFDADRGKAAVWLLTIARSRALDRLRSRKRRAAEVPEYGPEGDSRFARLADDSATAGEAAETSDQRERVLTALRALPDEQQTVVQLAYYDGLSQSEIAERLELPLGTVKTRTRLAFGKLRDSLQNLWEGAT